MPVIKKEVKNTENEKQKIKIKYGVDVAIETKEEAVERVSNMAKRDGFFIEGDKVYIYAEFGLCASMKYLMPYRTEALEVLKAVEEKLVAEANTKEKEEAFKRLRTLGIIDENGNITEEYKDVFEKVRR